MGPMGPMGPMSLMGSMGRGRVFKIRLTGVQNVLPRLRGWRMLETGYCPQYSQTSQYSQITKNCADRVSKMGKPALRE